MDSNGYGPCFHTNAAVSISTGSSTNIPPSNSQVKEIPKPQNK